MEPAKLGKSKTSAGTTYVRVAPGSARASCSLCSLCRVAGLSTYQKLARSRGCALTASCHVSVGEQRLRPLLRQLDPTIPTLEPRHKFPAPSSLQPRKPSKVESPRLIIHRLVRGCHGSSFRASLWPTLPGYSWWICSPHDLTATSH